MNHGPCDSCSSSDAKATYEDGHSFCFSCETYFPPKEPKRVTSLVDVQYQALSKRRLSEDTLRHWGYGLHEETHVAQYFDDDGNLVSQKFRDAGKRFWVVGPNVTEMLYGKWLWTAGGRSVTIVEGELDALSLSQIWGHKWPVVSLPGGAQNLKAIKKNLEWLSSFDDVVLMLDSDEPGREAAKKIAELLPPGKTKIAKLPLKDVSDMLQAGRSKEVQEAFWRSERYRPSGVLGGSRLVERAAHGSTKPEHPLPFRGLQEVLGGFPRPGILMLCGGTGTGKTEVTRQLAHHLVKLGQTIGYFSLEETPERCALGLVGLEMSRRLNELDDPSSTPGFHAAAEEVLGVDGAEKVWVYDHSKDATDPDTIIAKIRYFANGLGCQYIILDHISLVISGESEGDERRLFDNFMTDLDKVAHETNVGVVAISHLKRPQGTPHEEGGHTSSAQLRGSHGISQKCFAIVGVERNQQGREEHRNVLLFRVLKNRYKGVTGPLAWGRYLPESGSVGELTEQEAREFLGDPTTTKGSTSIEEEFPG